LPVAEEVAAAVLEAGRRLTDAGWTVEQIEDTPSLHVAAEVQERLWLGDGYAEQVAAADRDGDPAAIAVMAAVSPKVKTLPADVVARTLVRRTTLMREWRLFLSTYPVLLLPVSAELPFRDGLDLQGAAGFERVWQAQLILRALPALGLPALAVSTRLIGSVPVGVQVVAGHYREDLCLLAGAAIEAGGSPPSPIDPVM
jgi:amidase